MKGAVAAGHPLTAEAGARVLAEGGNAVDACVAAAFVSWVTESPLTGPGGGGFMLVHRARDRSARVLDFFVAAPGRGVDGAASAAPETVEIEFGPGSVSTYRVGATSCAVPGAVAGLGEAHRRYGRLPWAELVAPARELARAGVELTRAAEHLHRVLDPVLRQTAEGRRIYGAERPLGAGDRLRMDDLAETLRVLAAEGAETFYRGELARTICDAVRGRGGPMTEDDLAAYRVVRRSPVRAAFRGHEFVSNPPPSSGGVLVAFALRVLDRLGPPDPPGSAAQIARLAEVMREATRARGGRFARALYRGGLAAQLLADAAVREAAGRALAGGREAVAEPAALPSTTHVSVVDAEGNAASHSASTGTGSGLVVPGTGIQLNNMLGEEDLAPSGSIVSPGRRLTSMMAPSLVVLDGRPRLVVGSAGSARLRAAITQIVVNAIDHGLPLGEAIAAPRVHLEDDRLHLEGGVDAGVADELAARGYDVVRWSGLNLFFGGASAVALGPAGELDAAGDPRRGGRGVVVA